jgi:hypothetical protein
LIVVTTPPKKVAKRTSKCGEKVNPTDTCPKIVVEAVNSLEVSVEEVSFDAFEAPAAATTTATTTAHVESADDPLQIRMRAETTAARRFAELAGLIGSETVIENVFGGQSESETAVGTILGRGLGCFGLGFDEPARSTDPLAYGDPFSLCQNRRDCDFGRQETENTPAACDFSHEPADIWVCT